jgi:Bax protein
MTPLRLSHKFGYCASHLILISSTLMGVALYALVTFVPASVKQEFLPVPQRDVPEKEVFQPLPTPVPEKSYIRKAERFVEQPRFISVKSAAELTALFKRKKYTLDRTDDGRVIIPRLYLAKLPNDFNKNSHSPSRRELFVRSLLPLVLDANHEVMRERKQLLKINDHVNKGRALTGSQKTCLKTLARKYKSPSSNVKILLKRVDVIPPSLALAQAIEETGWGTSHAARNKNSTFGTTLSTGVKAYENLYASVRGYVLNLNSNPAYADMRQIRFDMRQTGKTLCSEKLMKGLHRYSELRQRYINKNPH